MKQTLTLNDRELTLDVRTRDFYTREQWTELVKNALERLADAGVTEPRLADVESALVDFNGNAFGAFYTVCEHRRTGDRLVTVCKHRAQVRRALRDLLVLNKD